MEKTIKKIFFVVNGKNYKSCEKFAVLKKKLEDKFELSCLITEKVADGIDKTKIAIENGADCIVAVGGDGTINEVVNGILSSPSEKKLIMAILPCGTGNDFVKTFKVRQLDEALSNIKTKKIDTILLTCKNEIGEYIKRYVANIADIGVSALAVKIVNGGKKRLGSAMTFFVGTLKAFLTYKHNIVRVIADNFKYEGKITTVVAANAKFFGGGMGIAPAAEIDDGEIDLTFVGNIKIGTFVKYFPHLQKQKFINHPEVSYHKTKNIFIEPLENQLYPVEADGEFVGYAPVEFQIVPQSINLLL